MIVDKKMMHARRRNPQGVRQILNHYRQSQYSRDEIKDAVRYIQSDAEYICGPHPKTDLIATAAAEVVSIGGCITGLVTGEENIAIGGFLAGITMLFENRGIRRYNIDVFYRGIIREIKKTPHSRDIEQSAVSLDALVTN